MRKRAVQRIGRIRNGAVAFESEKIRQMPFQTAVRLSQPLMGEPPAPPFIITFFREEALPFRMPLRQPVFKACAVRPGQEHGETAELFRRR